MSNQEAIALLRNLEDSLDAYCELNEEGKTAFRMAIEALSCSEFPNSSDTISRQAAIDALVKRTNLTWENLKIIHPFLDMLEKLPSAERLEVQSSGCEYWDNESNFCSLYRPSAERRGRWIEEYSANHFQAKCSVCGESTLYGITYDLEGNAYYMNYCPNCGARMNEVLT